MQVILIVLMLGTALNVANTHPKNSADILKSLDQQVHHPVISSLDASKLNK